MKLGNSLGVWGNLKYNRQLYLEYPANDYSISVQNFCVCWLVISFSDSVDYFKFFLKLMDNVWSKKENK